MARGLPYFSATLTMLAAALAQLANTTQSAGMLYQTVMRVATHVDPRQPFTVLRFDQ